MLAQGTPRWPVWNSPDKVDANHYSRSGGKAARSPTQPCLSRRRQQRCLDVVPPRRVRIWEPHHGQASAGRSRAIPWSRCRTPPEVPRPSRPPPGRQGASPIPSAPRGASGCAPWRCHSTLGGFPTRLGLLPSHETPLTPLCARGDWGRPLVLNARERETPVGQQALAELCQRYWPPVYAYVRRKGHSPDDAAELTQDFFAGLLASDALADVERGHGRFRGYLKTIIDRRLIDRRRLEGAQKRGAAHETISFDGLIAEAEYEQIDDTSSPEEAFDLAWALVIRDRAMARLERYYDIDRRRSRWEHLSRFALEDPEPGDYTRIAELLDVRESAVRWAVTRMRKKLMDFAREEVADTVQDADRLDDELETTAGSWRRP